MAWIPAVVGAAGSVIGGLIGQSGQNSANQTNIALQKQDEQWQTQMSNTAVQRRMADLKGAGINPILAGVQGGASVPSLGPATVQNSGASLGAGVQAAGQAAASAYMTAKQGGLIDAQTAKTNAEAAVANASVPYAGQQAKGSADIATGTASNLGKQGYVLDQQYYKVSAEVEALMQDVQMKYLDKDTIQRVQPYVIQLKQLEAQAASLGIPELSNAAKAQDSWWMKKISPFLPDILKSTGTAMSSAAGIKALAK